MSDEEVVERSIVIRQQEHKVKQLELMRERLTQYMPRALDVITELMETAENDRVRLAAAESILDRSGLSKSTTSQVVVSQAEHDIAIQEANALVEKLERNQAGRALGPAGVALDTLLVLEGEDDDTLPTTLVTPSDVVEATAS